MEHEETIMSLILHGGNARSKALAALGAARKYDFDEAKNLLKEANVELAEAHISQTNLIQAEIAEEKIEIHSLLMIHAQDHLMNALTVRDLAKEMIEYMIEQKEKR